MATIGRIYSTAEQAQQAAAALQARGFGENSMQLLTPEGVGPAVSAASLQRADVMDGELAPNMAFVFARALKEGHNVVLVAPMYGSGATAEAILDSFSPAGGADLEPMKPNNPSPFSDFIGLPTLASRNLTFWSRSLFSPLTRPGWTFSSMLGMPLLSKNPTPLSSLIGLKTLSGNDRPWTRSFGLPLLSKNGTPLSSMLGLPLLTGQQKR